MVIVPSQCNDDPATVMMDDTTLAGANEAVLDGYLDCDSKNLAPPLIGHDEDECNSDDDDDNIDDRNNDAACNNDKEGKDECDDESLR